MNIFTDEDIKEIVGPWGDTPIKGYTRSLFDKIEAKLREKQEVNTLRDAAQQALEALGSDNPDIQLRAAVTLRAALAKPETQSTHSADCYKWHHKCAIAEVERLRAHDIGGDK